MTYVAFVLACAAFGVLLGDRLGRSAANELWTPIYDATDELARRERVARLNPENPR